MIHVGIHGLPGELRRLWGRNNLPSMQWLIHYHQCIIYKYSFQSRPTAKNFIPQRATWGRHVGRIPASHCVIKNTPLIYSQPIFFKLLQVGEQKSDGEPLLSSRNDEQAEQVSTWWLRGPFATFGTWID